MDDDVLLESVEKYMDAIDQRFRETAERTKAELMLELRALAKEYAIVPKDGRDGAPGEPGPQGEPGPAGERGDKGEQGPQGVQGEKGMQGETGPVGREGPAGAVGQKGDPGEPGPIGSAGPPGEQGPRGEKGLDGRDGQVGTKGDPGKDGQNGRDGRDGKDGISGEELKVVIAEAKALGLEEAIKSVRMEGRSLFIGEKRFDLPVPLYCGIWTRGAKHVRGDMVTLNGSVWHCNEETESQPGDGSPFWTMAVKQGRDVRR